MGSSLAVRVSGKVGLGDVIAGASRAIAELIDAPPPEVVVLDGFGNQDEYASLRELGCGMAVWRFATIAPQGLVFCTVVEEPDGELEAMLEVGGELEPMGYVLAAALAISLARVSGAGIVDETKAWSGVYENTVQGFLHQVGMRGDGWGCQEAAGRFVERLRHLP
ncbi:hypothetical protein JYK02_24465 [Corallococcus macrosporus]|uniref:Uncharacterized protein n=1 Tax=Corallococcus macrosporus TaxID=35 RepID=A0ABS3DH86_9BACT|nr:hypothetical protein [Corallococcus macrosporus]MBN8230672.1 hypothetical protein [Corallococcus macrosporus]